MNCSLEKHETAKQLILKVVSLTILFIITVLLHESNALMIARVTQGTEMIEVTEESNLENPGTFFTETI